jgi:hypothetical protein
MNTRPHKHHPAQTRILAFLAPVLVPALLGAAAPATASERWETLEAIHLLENPYDSAQPGSLGELGAYQFREKTWRMHTSAPFSLALDRRVSDAVAVKHYDWLKAELARRGMEATPFRIALAWNGGLGAALAGRPAPSAVDYATRVVNLALELHRRELLADAR